MMCSSVSSRSSEPQSWSMFARLVALNCYRLQSETKEEIGFIRSVKLFLWILGNVYCFVYKYISKAYPRVVESDPVLDSVAKSLKAQVGKFIKMIDHTYVLPSTVFLL